jgi:hypothetical protein
MPLQKEKMAQGLNRFFVEYLLDFIRRSLQIE